MKNKILASALVEFSEKPFNEASLNKIIERASISKGIIYHYFKNKDDLYLSCIDLFFTEIIEYIETNYHITDESLEVNLRNYFKIRSDFFGTHPVYLDLFYQVASLPPAHLKVEVKSVRSRFDQLNIDILRELLKDTALNQRISKDDAIEVYRMAQETIDIQMNQTTNEKSSYQDREETVKRWLSIFLYGILDR